MILWRGRMNWPLDGTWRCQTCEHVGLTWGFIHAQCRCDKCHTEYRMRDPTGHVVNRPICQLLPRYKQPARLAWKALNKPIDDLTNEDWEKFLQ